MNPKTMKIGAAGMGTVSLLAAALSLGSGAGHSNVADASQAARRDGTPMAALRSASRSTNTASHDDIASSPQDNFESFWLQTHGHGMRSALVTMSSSSASDESGASSPGGSQADSITITIPHQVTLVAPTYEGGSNPSVAPPTYAGGTDPSVEQDGRKIVVDPGESGTWTNPEVDPGEPGTFTPPQVIIE